MSDLDRRGLRGLHVQEIGEFSGQSYCRCGNNWPCNTLPLLDLVEQQRDRIAELEREQDRLREELDEHRAHYVDPREHERLRAGIEALYERAGEMSDDETYELYEGLGDLLGGDQ